MGCLQSNDSGENQNSQNNRGGSGSNAPARVVRRGARPSQAASSNNNSGPLRIQYLQNHGVEKVITGQTTGEGIKRTPAYETPKSKSELEKWRKEFWETRTSGS